ncbi:MAG: VWA domain-containing protein [Terriglobia bacterium]
MLKVQTEVVNVYAVVTGKHGSVIPDLTKNDFELTDDGVPQPITYFSRATDTPLTLGIMVDTSPSQARVLPIEQAQATSFLREVMRPKDLAFVLHFDLTVELLQDFTPSVPSLVQAIGETEINAGVQAPLPSTFPSAQQGYTHLYDAVWLACSRQLMANQTGRKVLILLTDGQDEGSKETLDSAIKAAQKADVMIYSIDIVDRSMYGHYAVYGGGYIGGSVLKKLSQETGGELIRVGRKQDTAAAFEEIARQLRTQYLLGFSPTPRQRNGDYHRLRVRTINKDYRVQARQGYYASSS